MLLCARMGKREETESHMKDLPETLSHPDSSVRHSPDEARATIAGNADATTVVLD